METYRVQTQIVQTVSIYNLSNVLTDPVSLTFNVQRPDGTIDAIPSTDPRVTHIATGQYSVTVLLDSPGMWAINTQATNPTVSTTQQIYVQDRWG